MERPTVACIAMVMTNILQLLVLGNIILYGMSQLMVQYRYRVVSGASLNHILIKMTNRLYFPTMLDEVLRWIMMTHIIIMGFEHINSLSLKRY